MRVKESDNHDVDRFPSAALLFCNPLASQKLTIRESDSRNRTGGASSLYMAEFHTFQLDSLQRILVCFVLRIVSLPPPSHKSCGVFLS